MPLHPWDTENDGVVKLRGNVTANSLIVLTNNQLEFG